MPSLPDPLRLAVVENKGRIRKAILFKEELAVFVVLVVGQKRSILSEK
jgi:hypothetical protein